MTQCYDLYGSRTLSVPELRDAGEGVLGLRFILHESAYRGGEYFRAGDPGGEEFVIQLNSFEFDNEEEISEPEYADYPVILWIAWTERGDELRKKLNAIPGLEFLRRKVR